MMSRESNLVIQSILISVSLGTLSPGARLALSTAFQGITQGFLMKKVKVFLFIEGITSSEGPFAFALSPGDVSDAEAANALTAATTTDAHDTSARLSQENQWNIIQSTLKMFQPQRTAGEDAWIMEEISLGKGIPFGEDTGWTPNLFNLDPSALTTGASVKGIIQFYGIWLND